MRRLFVFLIKLYKKYISPIFHYFGIDCKYYPTCSDYTRQAIENIQKNVDEYIAKNCAYGCKYFILKKIKIEKEK